MNWAPADRAIARLALAVLHSALADRDAAFVASPNVAGYCALAGVPLVRYRAAFAGHADRPIEAAADA